MAKSGNLWQRYQQMLCVSEPIGLAVDVSRTSVDDAFLERMAPAMARAFDEMEALEKGAISNADEQRMVGHYWLRVADLAPDAKLRDEIRDTVARIHKFAESVHAGKIKPERAAKFRNLLLIGIGGSALGPQFVNDALKGPNDPMRIFFFDNTDPDGFDRTLAEIGDGIAETLTLVVSKSGGTKETRNGMLEAADTYQRAGLDFAKHAVAVTGSGSELDRYAAKWLDRFPMWDWVGGRTSELSPVGLLPARLQGFDIDAMLAGAAATDVVTRSRDVRKNPAALLALVWHQAGEGRGKKDMVILPYKDRLLLLSRYLQQLVMESLGKEKDREGKVVNQGIAVYGNKGSTDQHAYVQQLRDGVLNFFVTFVQVLEDRQGSSREVEEDVTSGDFLLGFLLGTRQALYESGRESIVVTLRSLDPRAIGVVIALFERAVGFYGSLVGINAYHQPGVEAGKKAAGAVIEIQRKLLAELGRGASTSRTAEDIAAAAGIEDVETGFKILEHLAANGRVQAEAAANAFATRYRKA